MKIAPLKNTDPWYSRIVTQGGVESQTFENVPLNVIVQMETVEILYHGSDRNFRPYLHLRGEMLSAEPEVGLPYGITELPMRKGQGLPLDSYYEFNTRQLGELVAKDYFNSHFKVPSEMSGIQWELPGSADLSIIAPETLDEPPLVFMTLHNQSSQMLTEASSEYDLAQYFPDYTQEQTEVEAEAEQAGPSVSHNSRDVFADVELEGVAGQFRDAGRSAREIREAQEVPTSVFENLLEEVQNQREADRRAREAAGEYDALTSESDYRMRVAPGVDEAHRDQSTPEQAAAEVAVEVQQAQAEAAELEPVVPDDNDVFSDVPLDAVEEPLGVRPIDTGAEARADAHREAVRRQEALRRQTQERLNEDDGPDAAAPQEPGLG